MNAMLLNTIAQEYIAGKIKRISLNTASGLQRALTEMERTPAGLPCAIDIGLRNICCRGIPPVYFIFAPDTTSA